MRDIYYYDNGDNIATLFHKVDDEYHLLQHTQVYYAPDCLYEFVKLNDVYTIFINELCTMFNFRYARYAVDSDAIWLTSIKDNGMTYECDICSNNGDIYFNNRLLLYDGGAIRRITVKYDDSDERALFNAINELYNNAS